MKQMNDRYLIISGTNRPGSNTYKVASQYQQVLQHKKMLSSLITLEGVDLSQRSSSYECLENQNLIPSQKFIFIAPEYNGSIPGVLKTMLDLSDSQKTWWGKKALLVGISTGRSGNIRGMEHLTSILNYMKVVVHPNKLPISSIDKLINGSGMISDSETLKAIDLQLNEFIEF